MLDFEPTDHVERLLAYPIKERWLFELALTAPGADEANHDGNRMLARKGALAMELALTRELESRRLPCASINSLVQTAKKKEVKETMAKEKGLVQMLRLSPRQQGGGPSPATLRSAIDALLGAVSEDSGFCLRTVCDVALRLGFLTPHDLLVDPQRLQSLTELDSARCDPFDPYLDLIDFDMADTSYDFALASSRPGVEDLFPALSDVDTSTQDTHEAGMRGAQDTHSTDRPSTRQISIRASLPGRSTPRTQRAARRPVRGSSSPSDNHRFLEEELSPKHMMQLRNLIGSDSSAEDFQTVVLTNFARSIGQSASIAYLKSLVDGYWTSQHHRGRTQEHDPMHMSVKDRMMEISMLDGQIAFHGFLRTFHVYKLISDNAYGLQEAEGPFVVTGIDSAGSPVPRTSGNPRMKALAQLHEAMMTGIFGDLPIDSPLYRKRYKEVVIMRRTSCRLRQVVSAFGLGLLGLVPFEGTLTDPLIGLLGHAIRMFSDRRWTVLLDFLDKQHGEAIRRMCEGYQPLVESLFRRTLPASSKLPCDGWAH